jgi:hypothetical protein
MPEQLSAGLARLARAATLPNVLHALLALNALSLAFRCFDGTLFGWHPFAMSVGYVFFMAEGLVSAWALRPTVSEERVRGIEAHAFMQVGGGDSAVPTGAALQPVASVSPRHAAAAIAAG